VGGGGGGGESSRKKNDEILFSVSGVGLVKV